MRKYFLAFVCSVCVITSFGQYYKQISDKFEQYSYVISGTRYIYCDSSNHKIYFVGEYSDSTTDSTYSILLAYDIGPDTLQSVLQLTNDGDANMDAMEIYQGKIYIGGVTNYTSDYHYRVYLLTGDGVNWDTVSQQPNGYVAYLYNNDNKLYVAGDFNAIGDVPYNKIAWYDGHNWHAMAQNNCFDANTDIWDLVNYQGYLYGCGTIADTCNAQMFQLARYNGSNWEAVPGWSVGNDSYVDALCVYNGVLYVSGWFFYSDGVSLGNCIVGFDGEKWFSPGAGADWEVSSMCVMNGKLYVTGIFTTVDDSINTNCVAVWDGSRWCSIDSQQIEVNGYTVCASIDSLLVLAGGFDFIGTDRFYRHAFWTGINYTDSCGAIDNISSINEVTKQNFDLDIYPNPTANQLIISVTGFQPQTTTIYNLNGQQLINLPFAREVDISILPPGVYFVEVTGTQATEVRKLVKI